jgi:hypothetical protein
MTAFYDTSTVTTFIPSVSKGLPFNASKSATTVAYSTFSLNEVLNILSISNNYIP